MVTYLCMSHTISVSKSCGGSCKKLVMCEWLLWVNWFHNQFSRTVVIVAMYLPLWSYMLDSCLCICMVGLLLRRFLSGLHSCMLVCKLVMLMGGPMYFLSFVWVCVRWVAYVWVACCSIVAFWNCVMSNKLWPSRMLSGCRRSFSLHHCSVVPCGVCH